MSFGLCEEIPLKHQILKDNRDGVWLALMGIIARHRIANNFIHMIS